MSKNLVITIGREFGSGGREIARKVADILGVKLYDKELITLMARQSGLNEEVVADMDETAANSFLYALSTGALSSPAMISAYTELPIADKAFIACAQIIKDLALREPCVIVGRCADSILKEHENLLTVFIHADIEQRITRICEHESISRDKAAAVIRKADKKRASYHNFYAETKWGSRSAYDLCIDSRIGIDAAAKVIVAAAKSLI